MTELERLAREYRNATKHLKECKFLLFDQHQDELLERLHHICTIQSLNTEPDKWNGRQSLKQWIASLSIEGMKKEMKGCLSIEWDIDFDDARFTAHMSTHWRGEEHDRYTIEFSIYENEYEAYCQLLRSEASQRGVAKKTIEDAELAKKEEDERALLKKLKEKYEEA